MALAAAPGRHSQHSTRAEAKQKAPDFVPLFLDDEDLDDVGIQELLMQQAKASAEEEGGLEGAVKVPANDIVPSHAVTDISNDDDDDDDDLYVSGPSRLDTALAFANTPSRRDHSHHPRSSPTFGTPVLLLDPKPPSPTLRKEQLPHVPMIFERDEMQQTIEDDNEDDLDMEEVPPTGFSEQPVFIGETASTRPETTKDATTPVISSNEASPAAPAVPLIQSDFNFEESTILDQTNNSREDMQFESVVIPSPSMTSFAEEKHLDMGFGQSSSLSPTRAAEKEGEHPVIAEDASKGGSMTRDYGTVDNADFTTDRESSSSPVPSTSKLQENVLSVEEVFDAAEEMDIVAEEGDFAELVSQMKNQDLQTAQREIDEEIKQLNKQRKAAIRDSEDVTQHMISQIMVFIFIFFRNF